MTAPSLTTSPKGLLVGLLLFFFIKLFAISIGLGSKDGPRLGDDSFVYLYYGELAYSNPLDSPGPASLSAMATADALADAGVHERFQAHRVLMRTTHSSRLFSLWPLHALPTDHLNFYQAFWTYELMVLAIMTLGFGCLSVALKLRRLWLSLPLIALATFPMQGIHFLIPSTLALSFAMTAWALILFSNARLLLLALTTLGALLSHPIGLAHIMIGVGLILATYASGQRTLERTLRETTVVVGTVAVFFGALALLNISHGLAYDFTRVGIDPVWENFTGYAHLFRGFLPTNDTAALLSFIGALMILWRRSRWTWHLIPHDPVKLLGLGILTMAFLSNAYIINGYPADVPMRFLIPFFCLSILALAHNWNWPRNTWIRGGLMGICLLHIGLTSLENAFRNRDNRWPEIDRQVLSAQLRSLPEKDPVLYLDTDFALMASFLAGGMDRPAYAPALLALDEQTAEQQLQKAPPVAAVALLPRALRTRNYTDWSLFERARYGFDLTRGGMVLLTSKADTSTIELIWDDTESPSVWLDGQPCALNETRARTFQLADACSSLAGTNWSMEIQGDGVLTGVRTMDQPANVNWPWQKSIHASYFPKQEGGRWSPTAVDISFDLEIISQNPSGWDATPLLEEMSVISDQGGLVWLSVVED